MTFKTKEELMGAMTETFRVPPRFYLCHISLLVGFVVCNPFYLEKAIERFHHLKCAENQSLAELINEHFGWQAVQIVNAAVEGIQCGPGLHATTEDWRQAVLFWEGKK